MKTTAKDGTSWRVDDENLDELDKAKGLRRHFDGPFTHEKRDDTNSK